MSIISFIIIAIAFGISTMVLMKRCAEATPVRLSAGLLIATMVAMVHTVLFIVGMLAGNLLRFESADDPFAYAEVNALVLMGMTVVVLLKLLFPYLRREPKLAVFPLNGGLGRTLLMTVASGINIFLLGMGVGFVALLSQGVHRAVWPLFTLTLLFSYLGIMYGRQKVEMRPRRWIIISCVLLLGVAIAAVVNAG